ncbi:MAG: MFS transporter [Candidatus Hadarchaeales archaeon]
MKMKFVISSPFDLMGIFIKSFPPFAMILIVATTKIFYVCSCYNKQMTGNITRWRTLACIWLLIFSVYASVLSTSVVLNEISQEIGLTASQAGLVLSAPLIMLAIFAFVGGLFGDRVGSKRTAGIGGIIFSVSSIMRGLSSDFFVLLAFSLLLGIGWGLVYPNLPKLVKAWFGRVGTPTGIYSTGIFIGCTMGLAATPSLIHPYAGSWRGVFYIWGVMALLIALLWWVLAGEPSGRKREVQTERHLEWGLFKNRHIWLVAIFFGLAGNMTFYVVSGWFPTFFMEKGISESASAFMTSLVTMVSIPSVFLIPFLSDRSGRRRPYMWVSCIVAAAAFAVMITGPQEFYWALMVIIGITLTATFIMGLILPVELVGEERGAAASGLVISIGYIIGALGPWIAGQLKEMTSSLSSSILMLVVVLIFSSGLVLALPETGRRS